MAGKRATKKKQGKSDRNEIPRRSKPVADEDMDDEIDAFHKQRDFIPLDVNELSGDSDDDEEMPVFDIQENSESDDSDDDIAETGFEAKLVKQQKLMSRKSGGIEEQMNDEEEDEEEEPKARWGARKDMYYNADNADIELLSSDDESAEEEEEEVIRLQKEAAKSMSREDFGVVDSSEDEAGEDLTFEEKAGKGKRTKKPVSKNEVGHDMDTDIEEVKKDLNSLSQEELMDVLYRSAPELVGLLSEFDKSSEELETEIDPLLKKVEDGEIKLEGGVGYVELKKKIYLSYCQAIALYLLLKSEGEPVRDHPILDHLVEIKSFYDKTKELDTHCPLKLEEILQKSGAVKKSREERVGVSALKSLTNPSSEDQTTILPIKIAELKNVEISNGNGKKTEKRKHQDNESMKMLRIKAALEERLKQKGGFGSITSKAHENHKPNKLLNRRLETYNDFDDETGNANDRKSSRSSTKLPQLVSGGPNKSKIASGDGDLPVRDTIGERRKKHERRVLARAGVGLEEEDEEEEEDEKEDKEEESGSEDDFYQQVKRQRAAKAAVKAQTYSRTELVPALPETTDGKRLISYQMEKNRGLTRQRNKLKKNPRKNYKLKHIKAVKNRAGQVRQVRKPSGPYSGELTGINAGISRSVRFNS